MGSIESKTACTDDNAYFLNSDNFLLKTLLKVDSVPNEELYCFKKALTMFTHNPATTTRNDGLQSLRACQANFFRNPSNFSESAKIMGFFSQAWLRHSKAKVYINFHERENRLDIDTETNWSRLHQDFVTNLQNWYESDSLPSTAFFAVDQRHHGVGHSTILVLKKSATSLVFSYLEGSKGMIFIERELLNLFPVNIIQRSFTYPVLYTECVLWECLLFICLLQHPQLLDSPEILGELLSVNLDANLLLFELYVFFIGLRVVPKYVDVIVRDCSHAAEGGEELSTRLNTVRKLLTVYKMFQESGYLPRMTDLELKIRNHYTAEPLEI
jgi:hypothetical protein